MGTGPVSHSIASRASLVGNSAIFEAMPVQCLQLVWSLVCTIPIQISVNRAGSTMVIAKFEQLSVANDDMM